MKIDFVATVTDLLGKYGHEGVTLGVIVSSPAYDSPPLIIAGSGQDVFSVSHPSRDNPPG